MKNNHLLQSVFLLTVLAVSCSGAVNPTPAPTPATIPTIAPATRSITATPTTSVISADEVVIVLVPEKSQARYRVREQLVGINFPTDAVGATKDITGTIIARMDGTIISSQSKFRVDLRTLKSDDDRRDNFLRGNVLQTNRFPYAEFAPKEIKGIPIPPPQSGALKFQLVGDMTVRDVTKSVTWDAEGKVDGNEASGTASTNFNFAYFNIAQPRVPLVLSIQDNIRLEVDLYLRKQ